MTIPVLAGFVSRKKIDGDFINNHHTLRIPPLTHIRELISASYEIEKSENRHQLPDKKWIEQLV